MSDRPEVWWKSDENDAHGRVFDTVWALEKEQFDIYQRMLQHAYLYDPQERLGMPRASSGPSPDSFVADNVVQSACDTLASFIAKSKPRVVAQTDGAEWSVQRTARALGWYFEGILAAAHAHDRQKEMCHDALVLGDGLLKMFPKDRKGSGFCIERVLVDEMVIDPRECRTRGPRQMHQRRPVDKEELAAQFPDHEEEIHAANARGGSYWAGYRQYDNESQVMVIESWRLQQRDASGKVVTEGRHTMCIDGATLLDEVWDEDWFPFVKLSYAKRRTGWHGRGVAEQLTGRQRVVNRLNWQIDRQMQQIAVPRHFVHQADANLAIKLVNAAGAVIPYRKEAPQVHIPQAVSGEVYNRLERLVAGGLADVGVSNLTARGVKPVGIESGQAVRELTDTENERFSDFTQRFEGTTIELATLVVNWNKRLRRKKAKVASVTFRQRELVRQIDWEKVDLEYPFAIKLDVAGALARTQAGRQQMVVELAQAGVIDQDEARSLLQHPDLERVLALDTAAYENIEHCIEMMLDGTPVTPTPYQNLKLGIFLVQKASLKASDDGAPEEILQLMQDYMDQAAYMLNPPRPPMPQMPAGPMPPGALPPGPQLALPPGPAGPPAPAFAPQAMQVMPQ